VRTRFLVSVAVVDLLCLAVAMAGASYVVYGTILPWDASVVYTGGKSVLPMLTFMTISLIATSALTEQMSGPGVPRPSYGRMVVIWLGTMLFSAGLIFLFRDV
jgi:hypothetical protein